MFNIKLISMKKIQEQYLFYFDDGNKLNVNYNLWFDNNGKLVDVRNCLTEIGFSISKNSAVWEHFSNKYNS